MRLGQESSLPAVAGERHLKVEDVQEAYVEQKDRLLVGLDTTQRLLGDVRDFNNNEWVVRYPTLQESNPNDETSAPRKSRRSIRRSLSFADDPDSQTDVVYTPSRNGSACAVTLASIADAPESAELLDGNDLQQDRTGSDNDDRSLPSKCGDFSILRLDLKLGPSGSSTSPAALVSHLERGSIAKLLDERIGSAIQHMDKLRLRITDTSSKVLVTGDLNAGKSTFVNALLRREVMAVDQQPCTTAFCEVHGASENNGIEEVHVLKQGVTYSVSDESTFTRASLADLESIVTDNETGVQPVLKIYLADSRVPSESLLNNGVVDISLIDAPGLNRDSLKTTALFARQEEIDVVVFVVSAENHFTLSAKEFLETASNEKAYVFIVVNKFEQIKNKEKCKRLVLEQIKEFSPRTYDDAADLVHFVDSAAALRPYTANPAFDDLESSLRSFVLVKRSKSKLQPASTFLSNLLSEVDLLAGANAIVAQSDIDHAKDDLLRSKPVWEKMKNSRDALEDALERVEETGASRTHERTKAVLSTALDRVGQGRPGVDHCVSLPAYRGLLRIWDYARDVRRALLVSLDAAVKLAEEEARTTTKAGVMKITDLGDEHLPQGVERSRRVFVPEAMFNVRPSKKGGLKDHHSPTAHVVVAGGAYNLGIGLSQRSDMLDTSFGDIFDFNRHLAVHFGGGEGDDNESNPTALSVLSIGLSALTMVGGKVLGARGFIDGAIHLSDLSANETARSWVAPVIGAVVVGATGYFIYRLPDTIPRTIGRRIRASLLNVEGNATEAETFINAHAGRVSRETRKVLRLASWDLRERFRVAMEERGKEVREAEELEKKALNALQFFHEIERRSGVVREKAGLVVS
ncbi:hypothetical protein M404DRAFT_147339 [Pisolithus tinctorius Marx 270]|uniref:Dynamin-type G domain-containing protein n=1 Tax=Pisolithus tinctorius Marx 270 TaxID=870435 RepID=A0A0C3NPJ1_PISTI|nr:hypothetical protein M404DRAFT_147339 [Pisolithus tinctorius Marx 270]